MKHDHAMTLAHYLSHTAQEEAQSDVVTTKHDHQSFKEGDKLVKAIVVTIVIPYED